MPPKLKNLDRTGAKGFSLLEVLTVVAMIAVMAAVGFIYLHSSRSKDDFDQIKIRIAATLSNAQTRSINEENNSAWGVHFESSSTGAFYALFYGTYSKSTTKAEYALPSDLMFATSSIPAGSFREIMFQPVSGAASSSGSVVVQLTLPPYSSSTIGVTTSGVVSY